MDELSEFKIVAPGPGRCRVCATVHRKEDPHDRDSLYYQNRFFRKHKRFPTWEDAMSHCTEERKAAFRDELKQRENG